jgi:integrase
LRIRPRRSGGFTITGTVAGQRVRRRAQSADAKLAREEAAMLEATLLRTAWHGQRRGVRSFAAAVQSYLDAAPRSANHSHRISRLARALGDVSLAAIDQQTVVDLKRRMLRPDAAAGTYVREIIMPLRAILRHAERLGWCSVPHFAVPREPQGRTLYLLPGEVECLIAAAGPHLRPLLTFLVGTGARMAEALELEWRDVDLTGARAIFWRTKGGKRRNARLPPCVVATLTDLPSRTGKVFRWRGRAYADRERRYGGQIKTGWRGALTRAGLSGEFTPHTLRHTWASWHYALHRDLLLLRTEGGWSSVALVERYAHLLPADELPAIRRFLSSLAAPRPGPQPQAPDRKEKLRQPLALRKRVLYPAELRGRRLASPPYRIESHERQSLSSVTADPVVAKIVGS